MVINFNILLYLKNVIFIVESNPVSFPCGLLHDIYKKVVSLYGASPTACSQVVS